MNRKTTIGRRPVRNLSILVCLLLGSMLAGCTFSDATPRAPRNPVREAEEALPPKSLEALQALRLLGAVQVVRYSSAGSYASPQELIQAGMLDPEWPRVDKDHYQVSCEVSSDRENFTCYADALRQGLPWFRIDDSQRVRVESSRRPTPTSPVFGLLMEGGKQ
ncbi:MAG: hypothetical protein KJZ84_05835 [Bryobacteraceae bacterium]|nr:hypothetical protein [Bryobacteraceae bacterium]